MMKRLILGLFGLILSLAPVHAQKTPPVVPVPGTVTPQSWVAYDRTFSGITLACGHPFHFDVLPPPSYDPTNHIYPLYIWFHPDHQGDPWYLGQNTDPLFLTNDEVGSYNTGAWLKQYPAFYVAPYADQTNGNGSTNSCSTQGNDAVLNWGGWFNNGTVGSGTHYSGDTGPNTFAVIQMIQFLEATYSIDPNRIYINGFSLGGIYTDYACLHYNAYTGDLGRYFAACAGSAGVNEANAPPNSTIANTMRNVPQWMFSGTGDNQSPPNDWNSPLCSLLGGNPSALTGITSATANQCGTSAMRYTLCPSCGHQDTDASGAAVWTNFAINNFLFAQTAGTSPGGPSPPCVKNCDVLPSGYLTVAGNQVRDGSGNNVRLACTAYDRPTASVSADLSSMRNQGFNCARVPWFDKVTCPSGTCNFAAFDAIVAAATTNSMKVVFDHQANEGTNGAGACTTQQANGLWYDLNGTAPWNVTNGTDGCGTVGTVTYAQFKANWVSFAAHYTGNATVLGFDLHNEPTTFGNPACCTTSSATPPAPAAAVGFNTMTFGPGISVGTTPNPTTSFPLFTSNNWAPYAFSGSSWTNIGFTSNSDGSVSMNGVGQAFGNGLTTASPGPSGGPRSTFGGQSFSGGGYFVARMKGTGPMSFWANDIETQNGASQGIGFNPWKPTQAPPAGQVNYGDWMELDMAEFDSTGVYGGAMHNWYAGNICSGNSFGMNFLSPPGNQACGINSLNSGSSFNEPPTSCCAGADFTQYHDYGFLWVPATATTQGSAKWYFDGVQVGNTYTWNQYNPTLAPPPVDTGHGGSSAYSVLDTLHMYLILGGSPGTTTTVANVQVWQANGLSDLPVINAGGGTGQFRVSNGQIIDPNGRLYVASGINLDIDEAAVAVANDAAQPLTTLFPHINHVRLVIHLATPFSGYPSPASMATVINRMTANGIVVDIDDHSCNGGALETSGGAQPPPPWCVPPTSGSALTTVTNWYTALAQFYRTNPYVWFASVNEPCAEASTCSYAAEAVLGTYQKAIYNAVRVAGGANNMMQMLQGIGGGNCQTVGTNSSLNPADYAAMTNIVWELHSYYTNGNQSGAASQLQGSVAAACGYVAAQSIRSADGLVPVIFGEWGSGTGNANNGDASAMAAAMQALIISNPGIGQTGWAWFPSTQWQMVNNGTSPGGPFSLTTWGQQAAAVVLATATTGGGVVTPGAGWGTGNGGDMKAMVEDVGTAVHSANPGALIMVEGIFNNSTLFNGTTRGSTALPITAGSIGDLSTIGTLPVACCGGKVLYSIHDLPTDLSGVAPDAGAAATTMRNTAWGYLEKNNAAPVWVGKLGASLDNSNGQVSDETAWASGLTQYMNGQLGSQGGPTFTGCQQPIGGDWFDWGNNTTQQPNGTVNPDGSYKSGQQTYWASLLYTICTGGGPTPGAGATTWNPADASSGVTLTGTNLIATTIVTGSQSVRSTTSQTTGKTCFAVVATTISPNWDVGIANSSYGLTVGGGLGSDSNGIGFDPRSAGGLQGIFYNNAVLSSGTGTSPNGEEELICADLTAKLFWATNATMRGNGNPWNNSPTANPATGVGGLPFAGLPCPCFITWNEDEAGVATLNATGPFAVSVPTGFLAWQQPVTSGGHPMVLIFGANENNREPANDNRVIAFAQLMDLTR